jgi:hypothetical protein
MFAGQGTRFGLAYLALAGIRVGSCPCMRDDSVKRIYQLKLKPRLKRLVIYLYFIDYFSCPADLRQGVVTPSGV